MWLFLRLLCYFSMAFSWEWVRMYSWWGDRNLISRMWCLFLLLNTMKNPWWMSSRTARFFSFLLNFHLGCVLLWIDHEGSRILKSTMRVLSFKNILKTSRVLRINGMLRTFNHWIILLENRLLRIYCLLRTEVKFVFLHDSFSKIFCFILTSIKILRLGQELSVVSFLTNILRFKIDLLLIKGILSRLWTFSHHISWLGRFEIIKVFISCCWSTSFVCSRNRSNLDIKYFANFSLEFQVKAKC